MSITRAALALAIGCLSLPTSAQASNDVLCSQQPCAAETLLAQAGGSADPLAIKRAINLARNTAITMYGGLGRYRPAKCMFASVVDNPCITSSDASGFTFTIPGGAPGWEQYGLAPSVTTVVVISPDGKTILNAYQK